MVIFSHGTHTTNFPPWLVKRPSAFIIGTLGVRVFFVISGYLITTLLLKEADRTGRISLRGFYKRRAFRILPVYFFYIFTVLLFAGWMGLNAIHASTYLSAFTFTTHLWGSWGNESWPLMHSWSLAIEEQFYLIWPAMLAFLGPRIGGKVWVPTLILTAPVLRFLFWDNTTIEQLFPANGDSIAFGCLLALAFQRRELRTQRIFQYHPHMGRIAAIVLIYLRPFLSIPLAKLHYDVPYLEKFFITFLPTIQSAAIAYLIGSFVTVREGLDYKFLNFEVIQWIGRLSYSLYIWQQLVMIPKEYQIFPDSWSIVRSLDTFPQNIIVVFALASISYYCLEKPFLALKAKSEKQHTAQVEQPVAVSTAQPPS
jgi:peptidoglycan/LPS O-acetylase OafA/YrhL